MFYFIENGLPIGVGFFAYDIVLLSNLVQLSVSGSDKKEPEKEESDLMVLAPDLIKIVESSILTFQLFMKMDKKKSNGVLRLFGNQNQIATPLQQIQSSLEKVRSYDVSCFSTF